MKLSVKVWSKGGGRAGGQLFAGNSSSPSHNPQGSVCGNDFFNEAGSHCLMRSLLGSLKRETKHQLLKISHNQQCFHIGGFGLGESMDERPAVLNAVTECLPEDKPRQISGLGLPEEVLQGVAAGIDLFNSTYVYHLTLGGFALTFPSEENRETWMQRSAE